MKTKMTCRPRARLGSVAPFLGIMMLPMLGLLALFVDYGYLLYIRTDMQRAADQAALAGVQDLIPDHDGAQDFELVRQSVKDYVHQNLGSGFVVHSADIEIGRYDPQTIYSDLQLLDDGIADTVRVTIRRDLAANSSVTLYFARLFDKDSEDIIATSAAVLQRARYLPPGAGVFPFAIPDEEWDSLPTGGEFNLYGDGRIEDGVGNTIPGNWGTVDIGLQNNSTSAIANQILHGLTQGDLDSLHNNGEIAQSEYIDSVGDVPMTLNGDTGLSSGMQQAVEQVHGTYKVAPVYDASIVGAGGSSGNGNGNGNGNGPGSTAGENLNLPITGWVAVFVVDSNFHGANNTYISVEKGYVYNGLLLPINDLSKPEEGIEGAYTSPTLIQ